MADMTYYDYINSFFELLKANPPSSNAQLLYHTLLMEYNNAYWQSVELHRTNSYIGGLCGLGEKALTNAKNELKQLGLIDFVTQKKKPTLYILLPAKNTVKNMGQEKVKRKSKESQTQVKGRTYKDKREKIEDVICIPPLSPFEGELGEKVEEWLRYKAERKQMYKTTGLKSLFKKIQDNAKTYGDSVVIEVIDKSMTNNWNGLFFDGLGKEKSGGQSNPFLELLKDEEFMNGGDVF